MTAYKLGYCRTSTKQQDLGLQRDALTRAGCDEIFEEQESGAKRDRPILAQVLKQLRPGDTFVCWKFDRIARSASHLLAIVEDLKTRGVNFVSLTEAVDTSTPMGKAMLTIMGAFAELERATIEERREAGIERAKASGKRFGRKMLSDPASASKKQGALAQAILAVQDGMSQNEAAKRFGIGRATLGRHLGRSSGQSVSGQVSGQKKKLNGHLNGHSNDRPELR